MTTEADMIGTNAIIVWVVSVDTIPAALWPRLGDLLNGAERQQASRFRFERDARHYQAAQALKRLMLSAVTAKLRPEAWAFETGPWGKPRVVHAEGPRFNLSHCAGLVACAVSWRTELGIDIEALERAAPTDLAAKYFAPSESAWLDAIPSSERATAFFRLWTLKEACSKAIGMGLTVPLDGVVFGGNPLRIVSAHPAFGDPALWQLDQRILEGRHVLALAWRASPGELGVEVKSVQLEALMPPP